MSFATKGRALAVGESAATIVSLGEGLHFKVNLERLSSLPDDIEDNGSLLD